MAIDRVITVITKTLTRLRIHALCALEDIRGTINGFQRTKRNPGRYGKD